ncbi:MAG: hypothetical protein JRI36_12160 [Deltaproteobacteria bacterium]|nr:hypothetical protein [Deltaproteobacteria bacterium]
MEKTLKRPWGDVKRCQAKSRTAGRQCRNPAMKGKRVCRIHGGLSTGPKSKEGLERVRQARIKHGKFTAEERRRQKQISSLLKEAKATIRKIAEMM